MEPDMIGAYGPWAAGLVGEGPAQLSFRNGRFPAGEIDTWRKRARDRLKECLLQPETGGVPRAEVQHEIVFDGPARRAPDAGNCPTARRRRPSSSSRPARKDGCRRSWACTTMAATSTSARARSPGSATRSIR